MSYSYLLEKKDHFLTITELTSQIKELVEGRFQNIAIIGEISNLKIHNNGHTYLSLKDSYASIRAVIFSRSKLKFDLKNGLKVQVIGGISLYPPLGQYQIVIQSIEPDGIGALQLAFNQLKEKLQKLGYFKQEYKKKLPKYPDSIGIITSPTGAAIRDMLNILNRRFTGLKIFIYPVRVQGDKASEEISKAIQLANQMNLVDILILGRGGGSIEDLWAFNEEIVAKAIFESKLPIVSAVGHEIDWTIADYVADQRAPTPSAAAEIIVQDKKSILDFLKARKSHLEQILESKVSRYRKDISRYDINHLYTLFNRNMEQRKIHLDRLIESFFEFFETLIEKKKNLLEIYKIQLKNLNPKELLKKGYSFTYLKNKDGKIELLSDKREILENDLLQIHIINKVLDAEVKKIYK